jgi:hypothetical protein
MEEQFHNWLIEQGAIPQICHDKLPKLEAGVDGEWEWNRNIDDPTILRTCNPINSFSWVWESGHSLRIANSISRMGGDDVVVVVLKTQ